MATATLRVTTDDRPRKARTPVPAGPPEGYTRVDQERTGSEGTPDPRTVRPLVLARSAGGHQLLWVPGYTAWVKDGAGVPRNVHREARLVIRPPHVKGSGRAAGKFAERLLASGGRLSYTTVRAHKRRIDAVFGRGVAEAVMASRTLVPAAGKTK